MDPTFQFLAAGKTARDFISPTRLILENFLSAAARLLYQIRTWWAGLAIFMALVPDPLVSASWFSGAIIVARWRSSTARLRRL
jgi:hypothetical protein